jgi:hypothetical protein
MENFSWGVLSGLVASGLIAITRHLIPILKDRYLYNGIRVGGKWKVSETRNEEQITSGSLTLEQKGNIVTGTSTRTVTRNGEQSQRTFHYKGTVSGHQMTLIFEDANGKGFDTGAYVFTVQNDCNKMIGMTTFHGKPENRIVSEQRILTKVV